MASTDFKPLAGLRGAQWDPDRLPSDLVASVHTLTTVDGASVTGYLYLRGGETAVCCLMHPREILASHYLVPELLEAGSAVWVQGSRAAGNDLRLKHELAVLDVDAGTTFLKDRGYAQINLVGNSGGGGLFFYYAEQANLAPDAREKRTPAGRSIKLATAPMVKPDLMVFVAPHPGQGILLMNSLDPSVTDETDALSIAPALFPFSAENGYSRDGARYAPDFVARYRAAQRHLVEKVDAKARARQGQRRGARHASRTAAERGRAKRPRGGGRSHPRLVERQVADLRPRFGRTETMTFAPKTPIEGVVHPDLADMQRWAEAGAITHETLADGLRDAATAYAVAHIDLPSGGGHDCATFVTQGIPSGMLFIRNQNGSHNPDEHMDMGDFSKACDVLTAWAKGALFGR